MIKLEIKGDLLINKSLSKILLYNLNIFSQISHTYRSNNWTRRFDGTTFSVRAQRLPLRQQGENSV